MPRNVQNRPATRAPHGSPIYTVYIGGWATEKQKAWLMRNGGSAKLRALVDAAMLAETSARSSARKAATLRASDIVGPTESFVAGHAQACKLISRAARRA
jgi:hypothetical protein